MRRQLSWDAAGYIAKVWRHIGMNRDELAEEIGIPGSELSTRNSGATRLTLDFADRILAIARERDPDLTIFDLGAPAFVAEVSGHRPLLDRLQALEERHARLVQLAEEGFALLGLQVDFAADPGSPLVRRTRRRPGRGDAS